MVKNLPANAGDEKDVGLIPGSGRSPGGGNGTPLQYSCRENPMDKRTWWAITHGVTKSQTRLNDLAHNNPPVERELPVTKEDKFVLGMLI